MKKLLGMAILALIPACHSAETSESTTFKLIKVERKISIHLGQEFLKNSSDEETPLTQHPKDDDILEVLGTYNFPNVKPRSPSGSAPTIRSFNGSEKQLTSYFQSVLGEIKISKYQGIQLTTPQAVPSGLDWQTQSPEATETNTETSPNLTASLMFVFTKDLPEGCVDESEASGNRNMMMGHYVLIFQPKE